METETTPIQGSENDPWYTSNLFIVTMSIVFLNLLLLLIYRKIIVILIKTFPRDIRVVVRFLKVIKTLKIYGIKNLTVGKVFDELAEKIPNKVCFYYEPNQEWTFSQVKDYSNRVASYFQSEGFKKGDNVALFMGNCPEFVCMWLGLSKIGVSAALINHNLRLKPLHHSLEVVGSKAILYGFELSEALSELKDAGLLNIPAYCSGNTGKSATLENAIDLDEGIRKSSGTHPVVKDVVGFQDKLVYIYTSGTTGLPKAAPIKHARYFYMVVGGHFMQDLKENDIQYTALPLYHSAGGILGVGQALTYGTSVVIKKKFSATSFWKDCIRYKATIAQYIGEICRYLHAQPPSPEDRQHRVHTMYGNGLSPTIWKTFSERFGIPKIGEFYGSTEGNCTVINTDSKVGSVGFLPRAVYPILPTSLVKVNEETGEILRNPKTNRVIPCKPNESGELIGKIVIGNPLRDFQGYADKSAGESKIIREAFRKGDAWFRSGDILIMDEYGYFYFKDRTGDTFRWKGENCSTAEVESVISNVCGLRDAVCYGVEIAGNEGRCGMVSIADPDQDLDLIELANAVTKSLPSYARPVFIRTLKKVELTGTYKLRKVDLQKEGFDINKIKDKIYFFSNSKYIPLEPELYKKLVSGQIRL